jgi:dihydrolipoamide dehydrogenase
LAKQGIKFKLNTKVVSATREGDKVTVKVDAAKGGKEENVSCRIQLDGFS